MHEVAEELEHVSSKKLIEKLDAYLGFPEFDPHGDPIPDSKGRVRPVQRISLYELPFHQIAFVHHVSNQSTELLELLKHKHITIGTQLEVKKHFQFDNSIQIKIKANKTETISEQLAKNIFVTYEQGKKH